MHGLRRLTRIQVWYDPKAELPFGIYSQGQHKLSCRVLVYVESTNSYHFARMVWETRTMESRWQVEGLEDRTVDVTLWCELSIVGNKESACDE